MFSLLVPTVDKGRSSLWCLQIPIIFVVVGEEGKVSTFEKNPQSHKAAGGASRIHNNTQAWLISTLRGGQPWDCTEL